MTASIELSTSSSLSTASALDKLAFLLLAGFVFTLPWAEGVTLFTGVPLTIWTGLGATAVAALRTLVCGRVRRFSSAHLWMVAFVGWVAVSPLWTTDWSSTTTRIGTYLQQLTAVWLIWELAVTEDRVQRLMECYILGALTAAGLTIANFWAGRTAAQIYSSEGRTVWETSRYSIAGLNENDLGLVLALSLPMAIYLLTRRRKPLLCGIHLVVGMTAILLTGSRGALLAAVVGTMLLPLVALKLSGGYRVVVMAACFAILASAAYLVPQSSLRRLFQLGSEFAQGSLTHRTLLWTAGLEAFRDHSLLGVGAGAYGITIVRAADFAYLTGNQSNAVAHNTFLSVLVELGVIGALLWLTLLISLIYHALRMRYLECCFWLVLLATWVVGVSSLTWEYRKPTWLMFGLIAAHAYSHRTAAQP